MLRTRPTRPYSSGGRGWDPAVKGVLFLPADLGNVPRSLVETCSASRNRGCVGCHAHAVDFVRSPDTPREDPQPLL